jgi:gluconokinase
MIIILMGVSGSGKTTVGKLLAEELGWPFFDADLFHPQANIDKMSRGVPLVDADRWSWLHAIRDKMETLRAAGEDAVITCSALKSSYRAYLREGQEDVHLVFLKGSFDLIRTRMEARTGHFFSAALLESQFAALEEPDDIPAVDIAKAPPVLVTEIKELLNI